MKKRFTRVISVVSAAIIMLTSLSVVTLIPLAADNQTVTATVEHKGGGQTLYTVEKGTAVPFEGKVISDETTGKTLQRNVYYYSDAQYNNLVSTATLFDFENSFDYGANPTSSWGSQGGILYTTSTGERINVYTNNGIGMSAVNNGNLNFYVGGSTDNAVWIANSDGELYTLKKNTDYTIKIKYIITKDRPDAVLSIAWGVPVSELTRDLAKGWNSYDFMAGCVGDTIALKDYDGELVYTFNTGEIDSSLESVLGFQLRNGGGNACSLTVNSIDIVEDSQTLNEDKTYYVEIPVQEEEGSDEEELYDEQEVINCDFENYESLDGQGGKSLWGTHCSFENGMMVQKISSYDASNGDNLFMVTNATVGYNSGLEPNTKYRLYFDVKASKDAYVDFGLALAGSAWENSGSSHKRVYDVEIGTEWTEDYYIDFETPETLTYYGLAARAFTDATADVYFDNMRLVKIIEKSQNNEQEVINCDFENYESLDGQGGKSLWGTHCSFENGMMVQKISSYDASNGDNLFMVTNATVGYNSGLEPNTKYRLYFDVKASKDAYVDFGLALAGSAWENSGSSYKRVYDVEIGTEWTEDYYIDFETPETLTYYGLAARAFTDATAVVYFDNMRLVKVLGEYDEKEDEKEEQIVATEDINANQALWADFRSYGTDWQWRGDGSISSGYINFPAADAGKSLGNRSFIVSNNNVGLNAGLEPNTEYRLTFAAKVGEGSETFTMELYDSSAVWTYGAKLGNADIKVNSGWNTYYIDFKTPETLTYNGLALSPYSAAGTVAVMFTGMELIKKSEIKVTYPNSSQPTVYKGFDGDLIGELTGAPALGQYQDYYYLLDGVDYSLADTFRFKVYTQEVEALVGTYPPCTIKLVTNGGEPIEDIAANQGKAVRLPDAVKEGSKFSGWFTSADLKEEDKVSSSYKCPVGADTVTLYAGWDLYGTVSLNFMGGKGDILTDGSGRVGDKFTLPDETSLVKDGYVFTAWYWDEEYSDKVDENNPTIRPGNKTIYAQWTMTGEIVAGFETMSNNPDGTGTGLTSFKQSHGFEIVTGGINNGGNKSLKSNPEAENYIVNDRKNITLADDINGCNLMLTDNTTYIVTVDVYVEKYASESSFRFGSWWWWNAYACQGSTSGSTIINEDTPTGKWMTTSLTFTTAFDSVNPGGYTLGMIYSETGKGGNVVYFDNIRIKPATTPGSDDVTVVLNTGLYGASLEPLVGKIGESYTLPKDVNVDGYDFGGWFGDSQLSRPVDYEDIFTNTRTVYALLLPKKLTQNFENYFGNPTTMQGIETDWEVYDSTAEGNSAENVKEGKYSLHRIGESYEYKSALLINKSAAMTAGEMYTVEMWVKMDKSAHTNGAIEINNTASKVNPWFVSGEYEAVVSIKDLADGKWHKVSLTYIASDYFLTVRTPGYCSIYIDDVTVNHHKTVDTALLSNSISFTEYVPLRMNADGTFTSPSEENEVIYDASLEKYMNEVDFEQSDGIDSDDTVINDDEDDDSETKKQTVIIRRKKKKAKTTLNFVNLLNGSYNIWLTIALYGGVVVVLAAAVLTTVILVKKRRRA